MPVRNGQQVGEGVCQDYDDTIMESEEQDGDLKFFQEARAAMADVRSMLGANAPAQLQIGLGVQAKLDVSLDDMNTTQLTGYMGDLLKATSLLMDEERRNEYIDVESLAEANPAESSEDWAESDE
jgi:hypothetical protein